MQTPPVRILSPHLLACLIASKQAAFEYRSTFFYPPEQGDISLASTATAVPSVAPSSTLCDSSCSAASEYDDANWQVLPVYNNTDTRAQNASGDKTDTSALFSWWKHIGMAFADRIRSLRMVLADTFMCR